MEAMGRTGVIQTVRSLRTKIRLSSNHTTAWCTICLNMTFK